MHLRLEDLRRVARKAMNEEKNHDRLRSEFFRVLGPPVQVPGNLLEVAAVVDEQLDLLESAGRSIPREEFDVSFLVEAANSRHVIVRKVAARLLPARSTAALLDDEDMAVRCAAANRLPYRLVREASRRHPYDDGLLEIARVKRLSEAQQRQSPKKVDVPFDVYGTPVDVVTQQEVDSDMPDTWYERLAHQLCSHYGNNLEGNWEEILATRVAASHYATSGVKLDRHKLLMAIHDCIKEREDAVIGEGSLKPLSRRLMKEARGQDAFMPIVEEQLDPVSRLLESSLSATEYLSRADRLFKVVKSTIPAAVKKYVIGEGRGGPTSIPVKATLTTTLDAKTERAFDVYVDHWNRQQSLTGEPYRLSWSPHPMSPRTIGFSVTLK